MSEPIGTCPCGAPASVASGRDPAGRPFAGVVCGNGHIVQTPRRWKSVLEAERDAVERWQAWAERARTAPEWAYWRSYFRHLAAIPASEGG